MPGTFDHHLHIVLPGLLRQLAEHLEFGELGGVAGIGDGAGAETVTERKLTSCFLKILRILVEALVEEIFPLVGGHPSGHERAAAADDAGDAVADERQEFAHDAGVNGHVVHALLGLFLDHFQHDIGGEIFGALDAGEGFVDGHGADGNGRSVDDGATDEGMSPPVERSITVSEP